MLSQSLLFHRSLVGQEELLTDREVWSSFNMSQYGARMHLKLTLMTVLANYNGWSQQQIEKLMVTQTMLLDLWLY